MRKPRFSAAKDMFKVTELVKWLDLGSKCLMQPTIPFKLYLFLLCAALRMLFVSLL